MFEKKLIFTAALLAVLSANVKSQTWAKNGTGYASPSSVCIFDISAPTPTAAWGIFAVFGAGVCGSPTPYYTRTVNGNAWSGGLIAALPPDIVPFCISAIDANNAWIATGNFATDSNGYIYSTSNGGDSWQLQPSANSSDIKRFIHFFTSMKGVAVGDSSIFVTTDGGVNWIAKGGLPIGSTLGGITRTNFLFNSYEVLGNTIWLGDSHGNFYKSSDQRSTWILLPQSIYPRIIKGIAFRDQNYGIAVASEYISGGSGSSGGGYADASVYTADGGMTWSPLPIRFGSPNITDGLAKYDIGFLPGSSNSFIVTSEYDSALAAFSAITTNGGVSWTILDSTEQHTVCAFTGPNSGYTGGYIPSFTRGVFKLTGLLPNAINQNTVVDPTILLYPNPASEEVNLVLDGITSTKQVSVSVLDCTGKIIVIESSIIHDGKLNVDVRQFPAGIYLLRVQSGKNNGTDSIIKTIKFSKS